MDVTDSELASKDVRKLSYPRQALLILVFTVCERYSYYGAQAILAIFLKYNLNLSEDTSTFVYHAFTGLMYTSAIVAAVIADQYLEKFKTIIWMSLINVLGLLLMTLVVIPLIKLPLMEMTLVGLLFVAIGAGGLRPCVTAFGGDQFQLPVQEKECKSFFTYIYIAANVGALATKYISPILREDIHCFEEESCYSMAFGMAMTVSTVAIITFALGKNFYITKAPEGSTIVQATCSIFYALKKKICSKEKPDHWLDHASEIYPSNLLEDTKSLLKLLVLFLPFLPMGKALTDQAGSRWVYQATRMNGQIGTWIIKPDQFGLLSPIFCIALAPLFNHIIYPILSKFNILKKPLHRIITGGVMYAIAFFISGLLELHLSDSCDMSSKEDCLHMLWLIPQYFALITGEVMFSVTTMSFAYSQAPKSMKTTIQAIVMLCGAFGNGIVMIAAKANLLEQANEFFFFGSLMILDMCFFAYVANHYKYIDAESEDPKIESFTSTETSNSIIEKPNQEPTKTETIDSFNGTPVKTQWKLHQCYKRQTSTHLSVTE